MPVFELGRHLREVPGDAYGTLLTVVPTVAGVVLGLYYGAIATLIQSRYGRVPPEVRSLVANDPASTTYAGLLALSMGVSLMFLGLASGGVPPTRLNAYVLIAVSLVALYGFSALGRRAFDFLDPSRLVHPVASEFVASARQATTRGYRFDTAEYQSMYRRLAQRQLDLLETLFAMAEPTERAGRRGLSDLAGYVPPLLHEYLSLKPAIPSTSHWYPRTAKQRRWYLSDVVHLDVALATRTSLPYEEAVDTLWVEERLLRLLEESLRKALELKDWSLVNELLDVMRRCNRAMGSAWSTALPDQTMGRIEELIIPRLPLVSEPAETVFQVALCIDSLGLSRLELLIGFRERLMDLSKVEFGTAVERIDWRHRASIYAFPASIATTDSLEFFRNSLRFERDVHGTQVTPPWYLAEELARQTLFTMKSSVEPLIAQAERPLPAIPGDQGNIERSQALGAVASRAAEYVSKLGHLASLASELASRLRSLDKSKDLRWPEWDGTALGARVRVADEARMFEFADLIPRLALVPPGPKRVDHFGQAVSLTAEECLRALETGADERFTSLFPRYFVGCLAAADQIARDSHEWTPRDFMTVYSEALIDLMAISGYSLVYSELRHRYAPWRLVKESWSKYLAGPTGASRADFLDAVYQHHKTLFAITPRSVLRTGWHTRMDRSLRRVQTTTVGRREFAVERLRHRSPLIRALRPGDLGSHFDGQDVFVSCFLRRGKPRREDDHLHDSVEISRKQGEPS